MANGDGDVVMIGGSQPPAQDRSNLRKRFRSGDSSGNPIADLKKLKPAPPPPPPPPVSGFGVMDVGQGSCVLAYGQNGDPLFYFDIGYPLWFYTRSAPAGLNPNVGPYRGPCLFQNPPIVLSHWDWDHWRLAKIAHNQVANHPVDIITLPWIFPDQNIGPATAAFRDSLTNTFQWPANLPSLFVPDIGWIVRCTGADINNSGLAILVICRLPSNDVVPHLVVFTGDASFGNVPVQAPMLALTTGITAVHHGADTHGAADNLPNPQVPYNNTARIAYSYGVYQNSQGLMVHPYGHPRVAAITAYQAAGFRNEERTGEGDFWANDGARGNIKMGANLAPNCPNNSCAFRVFPKTLD
jgi:hypothetical protein